MKNLCNARWLASFICPLTPRDRKPTSARGRRQAALELLEARTMLAGGFTSAPINGAEMATLLDGLDGFAAFGEELSETDQFAQPLALVTHPDGSPLSIGGLLDLGDVLDQRLAGPVRMHLEGLVPAARTTDDLVRFLDSLGEVTTVMGGQATMLADELRFELTFHTEAAIGTLGIDFGSHGDENGLATSDTTDATLMVAFDMTFAFGVTLDPELNSEQAFFLRGTTMSVAADLHGAGTALDMSVGFLELPGATVGFELNADFDVTLNNIVPDAAGNVTLSELNGNSADDLTDIDVTANSITATFGVSATVGTYTAPGTPRITVTGAAVGNVNPTVTTNADFAELLNFNNVDAEQLLAGLETFGSWLAGFADSLVLDVDVPFANGATLGNTIIASDEYFAMLANLRDADGLPLFDSAQQFAATPIVDIDYDPVAHRLEFPIAINFPAHQTTAPVALGDSSQAADRRCVFPLCGLATDALATLTAASVVEFALGVDLSQPDQLPEDQFSTDGLVVRGGVLGNATNLAGSARYGIVGIDFAGGTYSGTSSFRADIVDPNTGDSRATLGELIAGLGDPELLLGPPLALAGSTTLVLADVTLQPGLLSSLGGPLALPAGGSLAARVLDFAQPTVTSLTETGIGVLGNFANVTQDFLVDSLASGLAAAVKWERSELDAFVTVGLELADFIDTRAIDATADAVQLAFDTFEAATNAASRLQDVDDILTSYLADLMSDAIGSATNFVATLSVNAPAATLDIGLMLTTTASDESLPLGLDIPALADATGEATIQGIGDFSGTFDPIDATVWLSLDLDFQFDLSVVAAPDAYLLTTSALVASVYVEVPGGGPTIRAEGSIGILGVTLDTCSFVVAADRLMPDLAAPATLTVGLDDAPPGGRVRVDQLSSAVLDTSATGQLDFNCRVTVAPSTLPETNRFHFRINNLSNPIGSLAFPVSPPDFPTLIAGVNLDTTLNGFPVAIDDLFGSIERAARLDIFGLKFPLIGGNLDGIANVFRLLHTRLNVYLGALAAFDTSSIEVALESAIRDLFGNAGDRVDVDIVSPDLVLFTIGFSGAPINTTDMFSTDLGLPALGASFDASMSVVGRYHMAFTIGVSRSDGVYIDTSRRHEATVTLDLSTTGAFTGRLGFIQVDVTAGPGGTCMTSGAMPVPTAVHAEFDVGITDPNADGKLKVSELGHGNLIDTSIGPDGKPNTGLDGCADFDINAEASVVDWLPSVVTGISVDWDFDGTNLDGSVPQVTYNGVGLKLGSFLDRTIGKVLDGIDNFFDGVCPVIETANAPLPLIGEALPDPDSAIEIAAAIFPFLKPLEYLVEIGNSICTLGQLIDVVRSGPETIISFGEMRFGIDHDNNPATDDLFDARRPGLTFDFNQQVTLDSGTPPWQQVLNELPQLEAQVQSVETSDGELSFPVIQNPLGLFEYLLGFGQFEIFAYRFPTLEATIPFHVSVPLPPIPFLNAIIIGDLTMRFNVTIGYDTTGLEEFRESGKVGDLFHGFYVSDTAEPDGSGPDMSEFELSGSLVAGPSIGIANIAEVYVAGGIEASLGFDLIDQNGDGKIHGDEFISQEGCLQLLGEIGIRLEAGAVVAGLPYRYPFAHATLGEFNEVIHCTLPGITTPPETLENLATLSGGQLTLLMGPRADERSIKKNETDEGFTVIRLDGDCGGNPGGTIVVKAFGGKEEFCNRDVDSIYADAGDGNDRVTIDSRIHKPATLLGGDGDDVLIGGSGADSVSGQQGNDFIDGGDEIDHLDGGNGNDVIDGGPGGDIINGGNGHDSIAGEEDGDVINGGDGNDTIEGGDENSPGDTIDGGNGDDIIYGEFGDDVITTGDGENIAYGDPGKDTITGGADDDAIYGGDDDDSILGLAGEDVLLGDAGNDHLFGGDDYDLIDGGADDDQIKGELGDDELYGGDGDDSIEGNNGADLIEGGSGDDYSLVGGSGSDTIRGGDGNDTVIGNDDADFLYGDAGDDDIRGQLGSDSIEGGAGNDLITGGDDDDTIRGNDGDDEIDGGPGADQIFGNAGNDAIHGNEGTPVGAPPCDVEFDFDPDTIDGGDGTDNISGDCDHDVITGGDDRDTIHGNDGSDSIDGGPGDDDLFGDAGFDTITGGSGSDVISGGSEADLIRGGTGDDAILGDSGIDSLYGDGGDDTIEGGTQADIIDGGAHDDHLIGNGDADQIFGNTGEDVIEGNDGGDVIRGNEGNDAIEGNGGGDDLIGGDGRDTVAGGDDNDTIQGGPDEDLLYGDDGDDELSGGGANDTIRGGEDNDTAHGDAGDDLVIGNGGNDMLFGDDGQDVLYGNLGADTLTGGADNDRAYGQFGNDVLNGDDGDDILEDGPGDDTASGGPGRDALYGDAGVDSLSGGDDDDFLMAGGGVGDVLNGDKGNDHIVGSDDGGEDPNFADTVFFGDVIDGGPGDDTIESLGGADVIKIGQGNDSVNDGTHTDQITGGVPLPGPAASQNLSTGPDVGGHWGELSGSATAGGLTQVGGFEEATFATDGGVYVAWVDWRNGNSEIYLAFHPDGSGAWTDINGSAHGGGVSGASGVAGKDDDQSRRPTVVELVNGVDATGKPRTELLVAWTSIKPDGTSTIEVAKKDGLVWTRIANPAQSGTADDARLVRYSDQRATNGLFNDDSALLGWLDSTTGVNHVAVAQYIFEPNCFSGFLGGAVDVTGQFRATGSVTKFDLAAVRYRAAVAASFGSPGDHDVDVAVTQNTNEFDPCPAVPNSQVTVPSLPANWGLLDTFTNGDAVEPTVGMRFRGLRSQGQNENEYQSDIYVAWHEITDRTDQVIAMASIWDFTGGPQPFEPFIPQYFNQAPRPAATSISDTIGYAAKPDLATSDSSVFLAWMDDGVHTGLFGDGDGGSSVHVMSALGSSRTMTERLPTDASNGGISVTGGSADTISITTEREGLDSGSPYVAWTEARARTETVDNNETVSVYLRHDLDVPQFFVLVTQSGGSTRVTEGGATDSYSIVLMTQPQNNVRIELNPSAQVTLSAAQLIFTTATWFTPQVVTVTAANDTKPEGTHAATIGHTVASLDPDYNGLAVNPVTVQIRDNDFSITDFVPQFAGAGRKRTIAVVTLTTIGVVDPAQVNLQDFRLSSPNARGAAKPIPLRSIAFDPATELATMTPNKPLNLNKDYHLTVTNLGDSAAAQPFVLNVGTTLTLLDRDGDRATLTLSGSPGFGYFKTLGAKNEVSIETLDFHTTISGSGSGIVLSGTAKRGRTGNGLVTLPATHTLGVSPGTTFVSTLTNPPVRIGPLPQSVIDELLAASGGTLAGVLV